MAEKYSMCKSRRIAKEAFLKPNCKYSINSWQLWRPYDIIGSSDIPLWLASSYYFHSAKDNTWTSIKSLQFRPSSGTVMSYELWRHLLFIWHRIITFRQSFSQYDRKRFLWMCGFAEFHWQHIVALKWLEITMFQPAAVRSEINWTWNMQIKANVIGKTR